MNDHDEMMDKTGGLQGRRQFMKAGLLGAAALAMPACSTVPGFSLVDAVRRVLLLSSENAFARLTENGGFWDGQVGALGVDQLLGLGGNSLTSFLTSAVFKSRLEDAFADIAEAGSEKAAPLVIDAVRNVGITNAASIISGGPQAATSFLRGEMGNGLIEAMVPELGDAISIASDPLVGQLINSVTGVDAGGIASRLSGTLNNAIWNEIGIEEAAIRADPNATGDPLLIGVFGLGRAL
ncbi:MAG: DUF4197 domain-containing protein [Pseudomonadota bacterium]